jgi:hypothetical protein
MKTPGKGAAGKGEEKEHQGRVGGRRTGSIQDAGGASVHRRIAFLIDGRVLSYAESLIRVVEGERLGALAGGPTARTNGGIDPTKTLALILLTAQRATSVAVFALGPLWGAVGGVAT